MTPNRPHLPVFACSAAALVLSSCVVKDGCLEFTWWQDAAAPVIEDDVVIESGGGYDHSTPAPERIPAPPVAKPEPAPGPAATSSPIAQQQPAQTPPPAPAAPVPKPATATPVVAQPQPAQTPPPASAAPASRPAAATSALSQQQPAATTVRYTVRKGDTLSGIARRHNTTVRALVAANGMPDANATLRINQVLIIPQTGTTQAPRKTAPAAAKPAPAPRQAAPKPAAGSPGIHTIKPGDTIYRMSRQYGVNPADLMKANGLTPETANTIRVGATLRIPAAH